MGEHCDGIIANTLAPELFFNRSWLSFDQILNFHRTGSLHFDAEICALVYKTELEYWGVDEYDLELCCQNKFNTRKGRHHPHMTSGLESSTPSLLSAKKI